MDYTISTCSTADISNEHLSKREISYIQFSYYLNDKEMKDDIGRSITYDSFYNMMREGTETRTSQPNVEEYKEYFKTLIEKHKRDIIHLNLSSGLSGSYMSCMAAVNELKEEYPDIKIFAVDSLGASSGMGLLVDKMADLRDEGMSIEDLYSWTENNKLRLHHWFFSTDLTFYVKGGRISRAAGWFGTVLKICPLLNMDNMGRLIPREKIRGKAGVIRRIVEKMKENAIDGTEYSGKCYISHADSYEDARAVKELIEQSFPRLKEPVLINSIGTTIGSHTGPGTVAVFFFGKERVD